MGSPDRGGSDRQDSAALIALVRYFASCLRKSVASLRCYRQRRQASDHPARHRQIAPAAGDRRAERSSKRHVVTTDPHPTDVVLSAFSAGTLDEAQRDAIAAHVRGCARCRAFVRAMEHVGGMVLDGLPPTSLAGGSLTEVLARLEQPAPSCRPVTGAGFGPYSNVPR